MQRREAIASSPEASVVLEIGREAAEELIGGGVVS